MLRPAGCPEELPLNHCKILFHPTLTNDQHIGIIVFFLPPLHLYGFSVDLFQKVKIMVHIMILSG